MKKTLQNNLFNKAKVLFMIVLIAIMGIYFCGCTNLISGNQKATQDASSNSNCDYMNAIFDNSKVHEVNIDISDEDWQSLLANALDKPKYSANTTIDGENFEGVRISTKGNASLFKVAVDKNKNRYSLKLKFNYKDKNQTYHGMKEIALNNCWGDDSYLRDYAAALLFKHEGIESAAMSFVKLSINGEYYGLYMAEESIDQTYLDRCFSGQGVLFKPESAVVYARDQKKLEAARKYISGKTEEPFSYKDDILDPDYSTKGADLKYTDDKEESYSDIFENELTDTKQIDRSNVIQALKALSQGNIDNAIDADEVLHYFAVQNFVGNGDSYTSTMLHNYILYENNGKLSMIPWDYNGGSKLVSIFPVTGCGKEYTMDDLINQGLDSPTFCEVKLSNRPMLNWIYQNMESYDRYREAIVEGVGEYVYSDEFINEMQRIHDLIEPYIQTDPTAFYTPEQFEDGYQGLISFYQKRADSLKKQANGELSTVTVEQNDADRVK